jgi:hypothetical protein
VTSYLISLAQSANLTLILEHICANVFISWPSS